MADAALHKKLGIKPGQRVLVLDPPADVRDRLEPLPDGATLGRQARGRFDLVIAFTADRAALERLGVKATAAVIDGGILWMAYPKKTGAIATDLTRDTGWDVLTGAGWAPVSQIAVDATWSAVRFKHDPALIAERVERAERAERAELAKARAASRPGGASGRAGARTIDPPADLARALDEAPKARATWDASSYTHRKEYAQWIEEAKKPETRARRVAKAVEMLAAGTKGRSG